MRVLGIDACLGHCSAALIEGDKVISNRTEAMKRGHVERLAPMVSAIMGEAGVSPDMIDLIGVTCGPGGFTGARLGAAFSRGLALASGCRAVGMTTLEALASPFAPQRVVVALDGRRGDLFVQIFEPEASSEPEAIPVHEFEAFIARHRPSRVIGPDALPAVDPAEVARIALSRADSGSPRPLYLRAPDAKVSMKPVLR